MAITGGQVGFTGYQQPDYSGVVAASALPLAALSKSISDFSDYKKEQKKVDADNKASAKAIEAAITLGKSYQVSGVEETLSPFLNAYNDPNLSPIQKAAMLNEGKGMVTNVFGRFDAREADAIQRAQINARNAPPMPAPLTYERATNYPYGGGFLDDIFKGSDGQIYDQEFNLIRDVGAYARGESPEVYSGYSTFSDDLGSSNTPLPSFPENTQNIAPFISPIDTGRVPTPLINAGQINSALETGSVLPSIPGTPDDDLAASILALEAEFGIDENKRKEIQSSISPKKSRLRFDADKKELQEPVTITMEKLSELMSLGVRPSGALNPDGTFSVTDFNTGSLPEGMTVEYRDGGFKMTKGAGVGGKAEGVAKAQEQMKGESFRLNQANTEEAFKRLDTAGTNNPVFAAGKALMAEALPASETGELAGFYERINDENSFIKMNAQRASSPTGGAAGSMTEKEWPKYQGRFSPLKVNAKKDTIAKSLSLNLLNAFEATNGTPDEVIKLLDEKKIDQATYDNYVSDYIRNRQIARVNANGVEGESYDWTRLNKKLLSKSTIFEAPASSIPRSEEIEAIRKKYLTPNDQ
jgi:hypothetical protein